MIFLVDTNILIPLEPTSSEDITSNTPIAAEFLKIVIDADHKILLHPDQKYDLGRDKDDARRAMREILFGKYSSLPTSPSAPVDLTSFLGTPAKGGHDWVDNQLIIALYCDTADYLVTEDKKLRNKAARISQLSDRVLTLGEALNIVRVLSGTVPEPPHSVKITYAYDLDDSDPFFDSFKEDYPEFNEWLRKCKREHRLAWIIPGFDGKYAAITIIKHEKDNDLGFSGRILKICSFKASPEHSGYYLGELLLKPVFQYASENSFDWLYIDVLPKHEALLFLLAEYGFEELPDRTSRGEIRLVKQMTFTDFDLKNFSPLDFYHRFGPYSFNIKDVELFIVPIRPEFHRLLFPDAEPNLFPTFLPFGNSIRKAYLSNTSNRQVKPGDILLFYLSEEIKGLTAVGVVEETFASNNPDLIARFVIKRTVYSLSEICEKCNGEILAMRFWNSGIFNEPIPYDALKMHGVLSGPPQSIQSVPRESRIWLQEEMTKRLPYYLSTRDSQNR